MNKLINKLAGGEKAATPARKALVIATLITALAVLLSLITLGITTVLFSMNGEQEETEPVENSGGENVNVTPKPSALEYTALANYDALEEKLDKSTDFYGDQRIVKDASGKAKEGHKYYARMNGDVKLSSSTMSAAHELFVAFYKANSTKLVTETGTSPDYNGNCNIPMVTDVKDGGYTFSLVVFNADDKPMANSGIYTWIFANAYKYGFVFTETENTFTYVGAAAAQYAKATNPALDKLSAPVSVTVSNTGSYQIYFVSADADEVKVPSNYEYTVTPYKGEGCIITANMSKKTAS